MRRAGAPLLALVALAALAALATPAASTAAPAAAPGVGADPIVLVVDTSESMSEADEGGRRRKIDGAKLALLDFLDAVDRGTPVALRTYPEFPGATCNSGRNVVVGAGGTDRFPPLNGSTAPALSREIRGLVPQGDTPTAEAMHAAYQDLVAKGYRRGTLIIVSDGESTCADPCAEAEAIAAKGIDLQTLTVGFRISEDGAKQLRCIADKLGGRYLDAKSGKEVADAVTDAASARLEVTLDHARVEVAADSTAQLTATVRAGSETAARDVQVWLRFTGDGAPAVQRPVQRLGNLGEGGAERRVTWTFRPGGAVLDRAAGGGGRARTLPFTVTARAENADAAAAAGDVVVRDAATRADAGPLLKDRRLAILGDSYSAGEGADDYLKGTNQSGNTCHRSRFTYLMNAFSIPDENLLACSGAVVNDLYVNNDGNHVDAQLTQLRRIAPDVDGVVLTMLGNDLQFKELAVSCLANPLEPCDERVRTSLTDVTGETAESFLDSRPGNDVYLTRAEGAYRAIHAVLNSKAAVARRHGVAPVIVLAYPIPVPLTGRSCPPMFGLLDPAEMAYVTRFGTAVNELVERAVLAARRGGVPVYFVPGTETAFLPDHTFCDGQPYARALNSFNGAGINADEAEAIAFAALQRRPTPAALRALKNLIGRAIQELAHPNKDGYAAETRAIIRWSRSAEARAAVGELAAAAKPGEPPRFEASGEDLGQRRGRAAPVLREGASYPITGGGFAPGAQLEVQLHSSPVTLALPRADAHGRFATRVAIDASLPAGRHEIVIAGPTAGGRERTIRVAVKIAAPTRWTTGRVLGAATLGTGLLAAALAGVAALAGLLERRRARPAR